MHGNPHDSTAIDKAFLKSLIQWYKLLAENIARLNPFLNDYDLKLAVQKTIITIIFLRVAEELKTEKYYRLRDTKHLKAAGSVYRRLNHLFIVVCSKYSNNLSVFDYAKFSRTIEIDNTVLKSIIKSLYASECPFDFGVLGIEVLGKVYEAFLGYEIKFGEKRSVLLEQKSGVRKACGIYYTPKYIVDYLLENTVGTLVKNMQPEAVANLTILDPACGCGSFLLGAYEYLLSWHLNYYMPKFTTLIKSKLWSGYTEKQKTNALKKNNLPVTSEGNLTMTLKKQILFNNLFGVDLDAHAVEITKLSLLLKCIDGEGSSYRHANMPGSKKSLQTTFNIKCGNSLIDTDFYDAWPDGEIRHEVKAFTWKKEFPLVFSNGGFDVIIGNPPYGATLTKDVQKYYLEKYSVCTIETAALFMIQARHLLKDHGYNGYILPKSFTYASNWLKTRNVLIDDIITIVDCGTVWPVVKLEMSLCISVKNIQSEYFTSCKREKQKIVEIGSIRKSLCKDFEFILNGVGEREISIALKLFKSSKRLNDFMTNKRGGMFQKSVTSKGDLNVIAGKQVQRYFVVTDMKAKVSSCAITEESSFIKKNAILVQNIVAHIKHPRPHIQISATTIKKTSRLGSVLLDTVNQLNNISNVSTSYLLGVLNSKIISWYMYRFIYANAIRTMHFDNNTTRRIPFPNIDLKDKADKQRHDCIVRLVEQIQTLRGKRLSDNLQVKEYLKKGEVLRLENKVNDIVCDLFRLTKQDKEYLRCDD